MMKVDYRYDEQFLDLKETANDDDFEFILTFFDNNWKKKI